MKGKNPYYFGGQDEVSIANVLGWFEKQIEGISISDVKETLYLSQIEDSGLWEMLPQGTCSLLVQPILQVQHSSDDEIQKVEGFVLLASSMGYACSDKDRAWIGALTNKIRGLFFKMQLYGLIFADTIVAGISFVGTNCCVGIHIRFE
ncbi:hypothetical protein ACFX2J_022467 [Malus domestica]